MQALTIPQEQWRPWLDKLSESFEGWLLSLDVVSQSDGQLREFREMPLVGITAEPNGPIVISVAKGRDAHVSHIIRAPMRVLLNTMDSDRNTALEIESADGEKAVMRFRSTEGSLNPVRAGDSSAARSPRTGCGDMLSCARL